MVLYIPFEEMSVQVFCWVLNRTICLFSWSFDSSLCILGMSSPCMYTRFANIFCPSLKVLHKSRASEAEQRFRWRTEHFSTYPACIAPLSLEVCAGRRPEKAGVLNSEQSISDSHLAPEGSWPISLRRDIFWPCTSASIEPCGKFWALDWVREVEV